MSYVKKSMWTIHFDGAGCSGCGMEVKACFAPFHDMEQYGIRRTNNPKHADVLLVTGLVNEDNRDKIRDIYEKMSSPKAVVAVGVCTCTGGVFSDCRSVVGSLDNIVPVDVYVPGCAARPEIITESIFRCFEGDGTSENEAYADEEIMDKGFESMGKEKEEERKEEEDDE